ncbi:AAA family ATPase (plasmid) [Novosphingobium sp. BL-8H]|uniref:AAA family ATPase n=1 Tax=Novosphingobium sp. BL-8H TaxID=3127640 RepID=UPI003757FBF5
MSLLIRRIALENFRKFRAPHEIAGLTGGLNIVIEPNETGKSTLLEAVRAALFLKHSSTTKLIRRFQPIGDNVAPQVSLDFEVSGASWSLTKKFIKSASVELAGPTGRQQGEAAEQALQTLLGFEAGQQGTGFDKALHGALGMLWVAQTDGLHVEAPGSSVRDLIGATLEGEAGALVGGAAFERIRARIDAQYSAYFTGKSGAPTQRLLAAQKRVSAAAETLAEAERREGLLETAFTDLDAARRQLATLRRELENDPDAAERADVLSRLDTARGAAQQLATHKAEAAAASARLGGLEDLSNRHVAALERQATAQARQVAARTELARLTEGLAAARTHAEDARNTLATALTEREAARTALALARAQEATNRRRTQIAAAHERLAQVVALEAERAPLDASVKHAVPGHVLEDLAAAEREVVRHRTLLEADGTRVELLGSGDGMTKDGVPLEPGEWTLTRETRIGLSGGGELVLRPSQALAGAQAALDAAEARRAALLGQWQVTSLAEAQARSDTAREAARALETLAARILAAAPADRDLDLAAGAETLRAFVAAHPLATGETEAPARPLSELEADQDHADTAFVRADAHARQAEDDAREAEKAQTPLAIEEAAAASDLTRVAEELALLAAHADFADLTATLGAARETAAKASVALQQAETNARAFDETALTRRLDTLAARRRAAEESRGELQTRIARLEAQVESDGGKGLAEHAAAAREEDEAARAALIRIEEEAETLKLLRETLAEAQAETARSITGPVAVRAARHVGRILPGAEPAFGDDLGLSAIRRAGVEEACEQLSKGTQEQLAILTRLAFADMLLEEGRPVSLILDDPLVYSDDVRLDAMTDLIVEASERMQVILLTCRERAFRHVEGNRVRLI